MAIKTPIKFTEEELKSLQELQKQMDKLTISFGQISVQKEILTSQENMLKNSLAQLKTKEAETAKALSDKYGKGTLDIESGEFTAVE